MGKNHKPNPKCKDLGRNLIKEKKLSGRARGGVRGEADSWKHTSDIQDGHDWNRLNLQSVTEKDTLDEFLDTAEMAGIEFTAEKMNIKIITSETSSGVLGDAEKKKIKSAQADNQQFVRIPRRPQWDESTSAEQLDTMERETFLNWRRSLAALQEKEHIMLTPYEKNLDVWRQLWRVIERCDVVCQIVDARNPLLYKCDDLEMYVKETNPDKEYIILVNKADYLTENQRKCWAEYFAAQKQKVIFWSALDATSLDVIDESSVAGDDEEDDEQDIDDEEDSENEGDVGNDMKDSDESMEESCTEETPTQTEDKHSITEVLTQNKLLDHFKSFEKLNPEMPHVTIGLVGYPNVGKSSTINALLEGKKTAVSSTPGKTKHFQTHFIDEELCLCDCPGLVFPSFVFTKADLVLNGILPVDQMRDHIPPLDLLVQQLPVKILESTYGINIQRSLNNNGPNPLPSGEDFVSSYAKMRGYMTSSGQPDCPRASRYIIKDYLKGKLLYCHRPPGMHGDTFEDAQVCAKVLARLKAKEEKESKKPASRQMPNMDFDADFFAEGQKHNPHYKPPNVEGMPDQMDEHAQRMLLKPWKKHNNRNKKEKLRRVYQNN